MILGFDTSGPYCAAALFGDGDVVAARMEDMARGQAERLFPMMEEMLSAGGVAWRDLHALGVGTGPGNFTGIRLSVSAARGLALALDVPAVGVNLLEAVSFGTDGPRLACHAARREQVYVAGTDTQVEIAPQVVALEDVPRDWAEAGLVCQGTAAAEVAEQLGATVAPAAFAPASAIARIAARRWQGAVEAPKPLYLRAADAAPARDTGPVILDDA